MHLPDAFAQPEMDRPQPDEHVPRLRLDGVTKRFAGVLASDNITFDVRAGEVHALLGENGAGKSTLMQIAYGLYRPDRGRVVIDGVHRRLRSPRDAADAGVGMVHQHFMLVPPFSVAANVALEDRNRRPVLDLKRIEGRIEELSSAYGLRVDPRAKVEHLSVGEMQRVEIVKALYRGAQILILDEPTALLTPTETRQLFQVMSTLRSEGRALVFISHKLQEVMEIADRITVLRNGRVKTTLACEEADERLLASLMVGPKEGLAATDAPIARHVSQALGPAADAAVCLRGACVTDGRGHARLDGVDFEVRRGEILGVAGVEGNGQRELAEALVGLHRLSGGRIEICGRDIGGLPHAAVVDLGVGFIPEDRHQAGLVLDFSIEENIFLRGGRRRGLTAFGVIRPRGLRSFASRLMAQFAITAPDPRVLVRKLSGGNQQKVVLAREFAGEPNVIVASQPTRGLDITATAYVHDLLDDHRARGAAIVLISTNLDEIIAKSDRIIVLYEGRISGEVERSTASREQIGLLMGGRG